MVAFPNRQPTLDFGGGNQSSCPTPAVRNARRDRLSWVESGHPEINNFTPMAARTDGRCAYLTYQALVDTSE
jgi:hypothetical protein